MQLGRDDRRTRLATPEPVLARLRALAAAGQRDEPIAARLNDEGIRTAAGKPWGVWAVRWARQRGRIARTAPDRPRCLPLPARHPDGRYSVRGAAERFGVSTDVVRRWIVGRQVPARQEPYGRYRRVWWLAIDPAVAQRRMGLVKRARHVRVPSEKPEPTTSKCREV